MGILDCLMNNQLIGSHLSLQVLHNNLFICPGPLAGSGRASDPACSLSQEFSQDKRGCCRNKCEKSGTNKGMQKEELKADGLSGLHSGAFQWARCVSAALNRTWTGRVSD